MGNNVIYFLQEIPYERHCSDSGARARCLCLSSCIEIKINQSKCTEMEQLCLELHITFTLLGSSFTKVAEQKLKAQEKHTHTGGHWHKNHLLEQKGSWRPLPSLPEADVIKAHCDYKQ